MRYDQLYQTNTSLITIYSAVYLQAMETGKLLTEPCVFDFEREHQKQKEKLKRFELVLEKKSEAKTALEALEAKVQKQNTKQANVDGLEKLISITQCEIDALKQSYQFQSTEYASRPNKAESGFLCRQYAGAKKMQMLEMEIEWTKSKTSLLELDLEIEQKLVVKVFYTVQTMHINSANIIRMIYANSAPEHDCQWRIYGRKPLTFRKMWLIRTRRSLSWRMSCAYSSW